MFLPASDIPSFVGKGNVDLGITGHDVILEAKMQDFVVEELRLGFGKCALQVQVPEASSIKTIEDLAGKRVVTSFEVLAQQHFDEIDEHLGLKGDYKTKIEYVGGSVEAACALGLADGIGAYPPLHKIIICRADTRYLQVDLVGEHSLFPLFYQYLINSLFLESGDTMRAAGLHAISTLLNTEAVLIRSATIKHPQLTPLIELITKRIAGVIAASKYVICQYNISRDKLPSVFQITPGRRAPTVSPLEEEGWVAVSSMVEKKSLAKVMDDLVAAGAQDVLVFNLDNCRV